MCRPRERFTSEMKTLDAKCCFQITVEIVMKTVLPTPCVYVHPFELEENREKQHSQRTTFITLFTYLNYQARVIEQDQKEGFT